MASFPIADLFDEVADPGAGVIDGCMGAGADLLLFEGFHLERRGSFAIRE